MCQYSVQATVVACTEFKVYSILHVLLSLVSLPPGMVADILYPEIIIIIIIISNI